MDDENPLLSYVSMQILILAQLTFFMSRRFYLLAVTFHTPFVVSAVPAARLSVLVLSVAVPRPE